MGSIVNNFSKLGRISLLSGLAFGLFSPALMGASAAQAQDAGPAKFFFESDAQRAQRQVEAEQAAKAQQEAAQAQAKKSLAIGSVFSSDDPQSHLTDPESRAAMRINPEAPGPFIGLASAYFNGDMPTAKSYARQFVRYLSDLNFAVKDLTRMIGEAMIEAKTIDEEDWVGVEQYVDYEMTQARQSTGTPFKVSPDDALRRIKADPKGEIEIYYFFTLNSAHARVMAPQVERLWQIAQKDKRIKMVGLTLGAQPKEWINSYKSYTGLTLPIMNGELVAKQFGVAFVPAVVIVTPNAPAAYTRTGEMNFIRLYQFAKTAQGENVELNEAAQKLLKAKIGRQEKENLYGTKVITAHYEGQNDAVVPISAVRQTSSENLQRF